MGLAAHIIGAAHMGQINPFIGAVPLQPTRSLGERVRRSQADSKNLPEDEASGHVIENPDAVVMISDDHSHHPQDQGRQQKENPKEDQNASENPARLDVTA